MDRIATIYIPTFKEPFKCANHSPSYNTCGRVPGGPPAVDEGSLAGVEMTGKWIMPELYPGPAERQWVEGGHAFRSG